MAAAAGLFNVFLRVMLESIVVFELFARLGNICLQFRGVLDGLRASCDAIHFYLYFSRICVGISFDLISLQLFDNLILE